MGHEQRLLLYFKENEGGGKAEGNKDKRETAVVARAFIPSIQEVEAKARRSQKLENRVRYM